MGTSSFSRAWCDSRPTSDADVRNSRVNAGEPRPEMDPQAVVIEGGDLQNGIRRPRGYADGRAPRSRPRKDHSSARSGDASLFPAGSSQAPSRLRSTPIAVLPGMQTWRNRASQRLPLRARSLDSGFPQNVLPSRAPRAMPNEATSESRTSVLMREVRIDSRGMSEPSDQRIGVAAMTNIMAPMPSLPTVPNNRPREWPSFLTAKRCSSSRPFHRFAEAVLRRRTRPKPHAANGLHGRPHRRGSGWTKRDDERTPKMLQPSPPPIAPGLSPHAGLPRPAGGRQQPAANRHNLVPTISTALQNRPTTHQPTPPPAGSIKASAPTNRGLYNPTISPIARGKGEHRGSEPAQTGHRQQGGTQKVVPEVRKTHIYFAHFKQEWSESQPLARRELQL